MDTVRQANSQSGSKSDRLAVRQFNVGQFVKKIILREN